MSTHQEPDGSVSTTDLENVVTCEFCGSSDFAHQLTVGQWNLLRCNGCETVFTSPRMHEQALNRHYAQGYYEGTAQYFSSQSSAVTADQRVLAAEVLPMITSRSPASLDIGCGGGQLVEAFSDAGFSAMGTEPSEAACKAAEKLGRNVRNVGLETFSAEAFDCVTAMHVLEHVSHPRSFLAEIARITKPNGIVVIEVPNFGCKASRHLGGKWVPLYPDTHLFHYTPETLRNALSQAGLTPLRVRRLGGLGLLGQAGQATASRPTTQIKTQTSTQAPTRPNSLKAMIWSMRTLIFGFPGLRRLVRWVAWELLGHGEYVRVIARKCSD